MEQTKLSSLFEAIINVLIGAVVALISQIIIFPYFGIEVTIGQNFKIMFWFTLISVARSYCIRRWFNYKLHALAKYAAKAVG